MEDGKHRSLTHSCGALSETQAICIFFFFFKYFLVVRVVSFQEVVSEGDLGSYFCFEFQDCVRSQGKLFLLSLGKGVQIQRFVVSGHLLIPTGLQPLLASRVPGRFSFLTCLQQDTFRHWDLVFPLHSNFSLLSVHYNCEHFPNSC